MLDSMVGSLVDVREPLRTASPFETRDEEWRPSIQDLNKTLDEICTKQLRSTELLQIAMEVIEEDLMKYLKKKVEEGLVADCAAARRLLWVRARHRGLQILGLDKEPNLGLGNIPQKCLDLLKGEVKQTAPATVREWHQDPCGSRMKEF